jgi:heavy metal efflux system protein
MGYGAPALSKLSGNKFGFSQPIEMRFNELIAGVREDLAVKVFGDEFAPMVRAANQIAAVLKEVEGANALRSNKSRDCRLWRFKSIRAKSHAAV